MPRFARATQVFLFLFVAVLVSTAGPAQNRPARSDDENSPRLFRRDAYAWPFASGPHYGAPESRTPVLDRFRLLRTHVGLLDPDTALAALPITPTTSPARSCSGSQRAQWRRLPAKSSIPSIFG